MPPAKIIRNADLSELSTFRLPARAAEVVLLGSSDQLTTLPPADGEELMLGGGSNTVFLADFPGRILLNRLRGVTFEASGDDVLVTAAGGENWHRLVRRCIDLGLHGLENLIMIPGSVGAAPMQNIGAYGVELSDRFEQLVAWDRQDQSCVTLSRAECAFAYRDSRFKSADRDRFIITSVVLRLSRNWQPKMHYQSLTDALGQAGVDSPGPRQLAATVMRLRRHRLPDPARLANAGSFFKNPILGAEQARSLLAEHPGMPHWPMPDGQFKIAAGWMIERLGWKGKRIRDAGVYANHALVLVNHGNASADDLNRLIESIIEDVDANFGVRLAPEPTLIGGNRTI